MEKYIIIGVFVLSFLTHLVSILFNKNKIVDYSKCFIVSSIIGICIVFKVTNFAIYVALAFGLIGDFLLIFMDKSDKFLALGLASFAVDHLFNYVAFLIAFGFKLPFYVYIIYGLVLACSIILLIKPMKKMHQDLGLAGAVYFGLLFVELAFAITFLIIFANTYVLCFLPLVGSLLFISSDTILAITNFKSHFKNDNFVVMLTYGLAQLCLAVGIGFVLII